METTRRETCWLPPRLLSSLPFLQAALSQFHYGSCTRLRRGTRLRRVLRPPPPAQRAGRRLRRRHPGSVTFNTVIPKLKAGKQCFSNTITEPDLEAVKKACDGQDFIWIEMQHSTLTWRESQNIIETVAKEGCIPFVRVPKCNGGGEIQESDRMRAAAGDYYSRWSTPCSRCMMRSSTPSFRWGIWHRPTPSRGGIGADWTEPGRRRSGAGLHDQMP